MPFLDALPSVDPQSVVDGAALWNNGFKNYLINGNFAINQRAFAGGALAVGVFGFDRWKAGPGGCSISLSAGVLTHTSGPLVQVIEAPNLAGKTITVSVDGLSGGDLSVNVEGVAGVIVAAAGRSGISIAIPAASTGNVTVTLTPASAAVTYKRVQVELGSVATAFEWRPSSVELELCQRYCYGRTQSAAYEFFCGGQVYSSTVVYAYSLLPVPMRATPAVAISSYTAFEMLGGGSIASIAPGAVSATTWGAQIGASGLVSGGYIVLLGHSTITPWFIIADAEL